MNDCPKTLTAKLITYEPLEVNLQTGASSVASNYEGAYFYVPNEEQQIIPTENAVLAKNIVIDKIPSSYGKIYYNGFYIRVS